MLTDNILDLIGNTPLVRLRGENIYAKAEFLNPGGSIKDRVALAMLEGAERDGRLRPDSIIVEPTSGNTGIGVALIGRLKGYKVRIVMPQGMSEERKKIIRALGAELILTPDEESIGGAVARVREMAAADPRVFVPQQFENPDNPRCHYEMHRPRTVAADGRPRSPASSPAWAAAAPCRASARFSRSTSRTCGLSPSSRKTSRPCWATSRGCTRSRASATASSPPCSTSRWSTKSSRSPTTTPSKPPGSSAATSACWSASRRERTSGPPVNWPSAIPGNIATVLPDRAERYFSTALL